MRFVCAGHVNWDVTLRVDRLPAADDEALIRERSETDGGSAGNVAAALAKLCRGVRLFASVGADEAGRRARSRLEEVGVDANLTRVADQETTRKYILVDDDGEVALLGTDGANEALSPDDVPASAFDDADALHLTSQNPATAEGLARTGADHDIPVSFDPGRRLGDRDYGDVLEATDLLFVNDREAAAVHDGVAWTVTKHGARGATVVGPDGRFEHEGFESTAVDTTGAGDAFAAGFLAVWIGDRDPERALAVANACGALAASAPGAKPDLSWERVEAVME